MKKRKRKYTEKLEEKKYTHEWRKKEMSRKDLIFFFLKIAHKLPPGSKTYIADVSLLTKIRTTYR